MKNSNDTIGNQTCDLPTCSAVPQPTALPRASSELKGGKHNCLKKNSFFSILWLETVWNILVVVVALFGILVSIWRKSDYTVLCTQLT